jgi:hypothetical protein
VAIAIHIAKGYRLRKASNGEPTLRLKAPIACAQEQRHVIRAGVCCNDIQVTIAIHIAQGY